MMYADWWEMLWLSLALPGFAIGLWDAWDAWLDWRYVGQVRAPEPVRCVAAISLWRAVILCCGLAGCAVTALAYMAVPAVAPSPVAWVGRAGILLANVGLACTVLCDRQARHASTQRGGA